MSLYRTWRPRTFADLVGQDAVVRTLSTALETGRLAHAYLFSGPRGSGKTSAAKILARCINCVNGPTATPDNTCEFCRAILDGTALDVLEIDAASNRGIDEIRALRDAVKFAPAQMQRKVYIVDEAHMLTREGANAFLKTLEEPPEHAVFILCTTAPEALPPTILSRCQRYAFRRIAIPTMIERMRTIAQAEGIEIDDPALSAIAYRADGGLRDALTMLEQANSFGAGHVDLAAIEAAFGATGRVTAQELTEAMLAGDSVTALRTIERASDEGLDMQMLLRGMIGELRHLLVGRIDPALLAQDLSPEDAQRTAQLAGSTPQARTVRGLRLVMDALGAARVSGNPRLELETAVLRYILVGEDPTVEALAARISALEGGAPAAPPLSAAPPASPRPAATPAPQPAPKPAAKAPARPASAPPAAPAPPPAAAVAPPPAPAERPAVKPAAAAPAPPPAAAAAPPAAESPAVPVGQTLTLQRIQHHWPAIIERVREKKPSISGHLARVRLVAFDGSTLTIALPDETTLGMLRGALGIVGQTLADTTGESLAIKTIIADAEGNPEETADEDESDLLNYAVKKLR